MYITADQLSYVYERKYPGIQPGTDFIVVQEMTNDLKSAVVAEWITTQVAQLSDEDVERIWLKLEDEYDGDPTRPDSAAYAERNPQPTIQTVENL